jgi:DnaK suppressor protein
MSKKISGKSGKSKTLEKKAAPQKMAAAKVVKPPASAKPPAKIAVVPPKAVPAKAAPSKIAPAKTVHTKSVPAKPPATPKPPPARTIAVAKPEPGKKSTEGIPKKMVARAKVADVVLPPNYRPSEDEQFMNPMHRAYFRRRLIEWKDEILRQTRETLAILHEDSTQHADLADRATSETDRATELRTRDRQRKLISKIEAALSRIEDGTYGFCEDTGEPIGLKRLDARPIATLSVEAQERHERREKVYREE